MKVRAWKRRDGKGLAIRKRLRGWAQEKRRGARAIVGRGFFLFLMVLSLVAGAASAGYGQYYPGGPDYGPAYPYYYYPYPNYPSCYYYDPYCYPYGYRERHEEREERFERRHFRGFEHERGREHWERH